MTDIMLYRNHKGVPVTHASYSARQTFKHCPREFELSRVQGWYSKGHRAATLFGRCVEGALQLYEERGRERGLGVREFVHLWEQVKTLPEFDKLEYTDSEGDWEQLLRAGKEMLRLYAVKAPYLPIVRPIFQQTIRKKIFPGSHLDVLENKAIFDMISFPRWDHPYLSKIPIAIGCDDCAVRWSCSLESDGPKFVPCEQHADRPLILDIKTTGVDLDTDLVGLDPQLGEYGWQSRIKDIGFLWFVKRSHGYKRGSRVSLLEDVLPYRGGFELFVLGERWSLAAGDKAGKPKDVFEGVYLGKAEVLAVLENAIKGLRGKARDNAESSFFSDLDRNGVILCQPESFTKQRLQFGAARLSDADLDDVGRKVAQTTVEMVRAAEEQYYPKEPGVRFPNQKCNFCEFRFICLNRPDERDKTLAKRGEEWLDEDGTQEE